MKIESSDTDVRTLLSSGYYRIPRFQRPFSWDRENVQEFWNDVVQDSPAEYFIGSMVLYKDGQQRYGVVDGQQRLTTVTILLCVLRNELASRSYEDLAKGIHGLIERPNIDNKLEFIVSTETSYPFFQDHIQKWGAPAVEVDPLKEEDSLYAAYKQLRELVSDALKSIERDTSLSEKRKKELAQQKLTSIRDALLNLKLILIRMENEDDAYIIFETLNTRGKDLSLTDLVKNHVSKHIKAKNPASDQAKIKWKQLIETIEGSAIELETDTFLHHFWLSKYDYLPAKSLFRVLKKQVTPDCAVAFLDELLAEASRYRAIHEITYGKWSKEEESIANALSALVLFRVHQQTPCVLSLMREYKAVGKIKKKHVEDALLAIEKFHFLFTAITSQHSSGGISQMYASLGRRLSEARDAQEAIGVIKDLKRKLQDRIPKLEEFKAAFPRLIATDSVTRQKKLVRYVLTKLHQRKASGVPVDYDQMTIEHLTPQSLIGRPGFDDALIGQLGNLLLVSQELNEKLKTKTFQEKKLLLKENGFQLSQDMNDATEWGSNEIQKRTQEIAETAYSDVWKL